MEANASLRGLVNRNTGEAYWDYVKRLAAQSGLDRKDSAAVRKFDRKRPKKMSNQEWENPDDPDAKIGPKKDGATDMIYKPQTVVDLDTGAIVGPRCCREIRRITRRWPRPFWKRSKTSMRPGARRRIN